ncbi:MAG: ABC transporter ATP-binding protein [Chloroflexales bacterium]|nr:ABC transporter ATP-binding protein [Chloroflexales bacterium]
MSSPHTITTDSLTKRYGERLAVDSLSLSVGRGEVFGFLGPNGAGKTTTIAMLLGLVRPTAGRATVLGHDVLSAPAAALARVGAMIEAPAFYPYLSGYDNLRVLCRAGGLDEGRIAGALAAVELGERARDRVRAYSQGMKQRLGIAATLLPDPELIILDEPTNGLDPAGTAEIRALIRALAAGGRTIFLCSHMLHEVEQLCERVAILKAGRLIAQGQVADLLRRGQGLRVRVESDPTQAAALAATLSWVAGVRRDGDVLLVDAPAARAAELNAHLAGNGVLVAEIGARGSSLEEFFLEVTGEVS